MQSNNSSPAKDGRDPTSPQSSRRRNHMMSVTLNELYKGKSSTLSITRKKCCTNCGGTGYKKGLEIECPSCNGQKVRRQTLGTTTEVSPCVDCHKTGRVIHTVQCDCDGFGFRSEKSVVTVTIPRGSQDNKLIILEGHGDEVMGLPAGDIVIQLQTKSHDYLTRDGCNLSMAMTVTLREAIDGFVRSFRHLDDHDFQVQIAPMQLIVDCSKVVILHGEGMPHEDNNNRFGDLIVNFSIECEDKAVLDLMNMIRTKNIPTSQHGRLSELDEQIGLLRSQIHNLTMSHASARSEWNSNMEDSHNRIQQLEDALSLRDEQIKSKEAEISSLTSEVAMHIADENDMIAEIAKLSALIQSLEQENASKDSQVRALRQELLEVSDQLRIARTPATSQGVDVESTC